MINQWKINGKQTRLEQRLRVERALRMLWQRYWRLGVIIFVTAALAFALWRVWAPSSLPQAAVPVTVLANNLPDTSTKPTLAPVAKSNPQAPPSTSPDILAEAKRYQRNFVETLNNIRSRCLPEWNRFQCNDMTRNFLRDQNMSNDTAELLHVYDQYIQYEDYVATHRALQGLNLEDTYSTLQQLRKQFIDQDTRRWLFGPEDARMAYEFAMRDFLALEAPSLSPADRLQRFEQLRRQHWGEFYDLFVSHENPLDYYQTQLELVELSGSDTVASQALIATLKAKIQALNAPAGADNLR